ncbi:MAG: bifunctional oligoribonuclease/PAP phosphatase NrnA [Gemmatimonadota bacterium]
MSYRTPSGRVPAVMEARNMLLASRRAVLTTHLNADGDGAGSEAALASWMRANGTEAWVINPTPFPDAFKFLFESEEWIVSAGSARARKLCADADLAVVLDTGEVPRIGRVRDLIRDLPTLVVDHHPPGDRAIGGTSLRDADACATGELIFDLVSAARGPWTDQVALGIYVAILTDTGGFRFTNATPDCHRIAADLIERGVNPETTYDAIYGSSPLRKFRLLRDALDTLEHDADAGISWMTVPTETYERVGATPEDLEGMVDVPRTIEGTRVALLFRGTSTSDIKVSFRTNGDVDVNALARRWDGGGHVKASGAMLPGPMPRAIDEVLAATREALASDVGEAEA